VTAHLGKHVRWLLGPKFVKHYVRPRRMRRPQRGYVAKDFFESWHRALPSDVSDGDTISAGSRMLDTRYHYNVVENAILASLAGGGRRSAGSVLDIGSGAGHWIDFYLEALDADRVVGAELSSVAASQLTERYAGDGRVTIVEADISAAAPGIEGRFDVINAVGVMFHIVEDDLWQRAVRNMAELLAPGGVIVVSGQFGLTTQNVQFHNTDRFSSWDELRAARSEVALVNKRIRSLRRWKRCAAEAGLRVDSVRRNRTPDGINTPENNVLMLSRG
jgi:SAM-dependent methyltransferase